MSIWRILFFLPVLLTLLSCSSVGGTQAVGPENGADESARDVPMASQDGPIDCNWENLLPAYMSYSGEFDYAAHVEGYIAALHPAVWQKIKNDRSAIDRAKGGYIREMENQGAAYDRSGTYVVRVPVYYGEYDVARDAFPLKSKIKGGTHTSIADIVVATKFSDTHDLLVGEVRPYPTRFLVSFSANPGASLPLTEIPLDADERKDLIEYRTGDRGYNRQAIAKIEFNIVGLKGPVEKHHFIGVITDIRYEL